MKLLTACLMLLFAAPAGAAPFPKGNPKIGKTLADKSCLPCHVSLFGGNGSSVYTRPDHKVKNAQQLTARVRICNTNSGANWFPTEEEHVAAYLNQQYYHFK